jgi:hypothetical protein
MAKIHISLVGGQPAPVYYGIVDTMPDEVILIHSPQSKEEASRINDEIKIPMTLMEFNPVNLQKIFSETEELASRISDSDEITVNISSGTKPWSLAFYIVFGNISNASIIYIDQNNKVWDFATRHNHFVNFNMDAQFRLYGTSLKKFNDINDFTSDDKKVVEDIRTLRDFKVEDFVQLTQSKSSSNPSQTLKSGSSLIWNKTSKSFLMKLVKKGKIMQKTLISKNVRQLLLKTGWFEYEIALLLKKWDKAKNIRLNCKFPTKKNADKNEIDIIVDTGSKLLFIECKTQIFDNTDIDKFNSAVKNYGGSGSKALFVTDAKMSDTALEKCEDYGILTFSLKDNMLGISTEVILHKILDLELFNINTK